MRSCSSQQFSPRGSKGRPLAFAFLGGPLVVCLPTAGSFCLGCCPQLGLRARELASRALPAAVDQGCLLLSTPSSTPITRARPPRRPIGSLGKSTFLRGLSGDWLGQLSVKRASRKDAAGVLGTRSPERRRSNLPHKQAVPPPTIKLGGGASKHYPALGPHWSGAG